MRINKKIDLNNPEHNPVNKQNLVTFFQCKYCNNNRSSFFDLHEDIQKRIHFFCLNGTYLSLNKSRYNICEQCTYIISSDMRNKWLNLIDDEYHYYHSMPEYYISLLVNRGNIQIFNSSHWDILKKKCVIPYSDQTISPNSQLILFNFSKTSVAKYPTERNGDDINIVLIEITTPKSSDLILSLTEFLIEIDFIENFNDALYRTNWYPNYQFVLLFGLINKWKKMGQIEHNIYDPPDLLIEYLEKENIIKIFDSNNWDQLKDKYTLISDDIKILEDSYLIRLNSSSDPDEPDYPLLDGKIVLLEVKSLGLNPIGVIFDFLCYLTFITIISDPNNYEEIYYQQDLEDDKYKEEMDNIMMEMINTKNK